MTVFITLFTLWLFNSVNCQIESQEEAINSACRFATDGLSSDTECALAVTRTVLVTNGIPQILSATDLNQFCGPTACAQLVEITPMCPMRNQDERTRAVRKIVSMNLNN